MTPTPPDMKSIFGRALEIQSPADRAAYLDEACGPDAGLRAEVEGLLATLGRAGEFMRRPAAAALAGGTAGYEPLAEGPGTRVGPYKLLQQIGEGGMGVVYMAEQEEPVRRKVALKIIKPPILLEVLLALSVQFFSAWATKSVNLPLILTLREVVPCSRGHSS
jgi:hypothetical protein